ncbi:phosphoesterase [Clostridia bacterium]|nr:phosphoesterase [Clostridia bacterium]
MKLLFMSDTHGRLDLAERVAKMVKNADYLIHLGDMATDAARLAQRLGREVISVRGNCDGDFFGESYKILELECGKILLVHGHRERVKSGLQNLYYRAAELGCKAAFYGHTHVAGVCEEKGILLVNPGSLGFPKLGASSSYGVAVTEGERISASVVYLTEKGDIRNYYD